MEGVEKKFALFNEKLVISGKMNNRAKNTIDH